MRFLHSKRVLWNLTKYSLNQNLAATEVLATANSARRRSFSNNKNKKEKSNGAGGDEFDKNADNKCNAEKWGQQLLPMHVMPLDEVLKRFLKTCEPVLSKEEHQNTSKIVEKFQEKEGAELQELLEATGLKECNWLAPRWLQAAYLQYRDPVTIYSSPGMTFPLQCFDDIQAYLNYTAKVIYGLGEFKLLVHEKKIPVVKMGKLELDNSQFGKVLGTCRIPCRPADLLSYNPCSDYVVVIYMNSFYKLQIFNEVGDLFKADEIAKQLDSIMQCQKEPGPPYGLLTHDTRDNWAEAYMLAHKIQGFEEAVEVIQKSLFTVSLDQCVAAKADQKQNVLGLQLIHGGGTEQNTANRWMDKTIQLVANPNGMIGFTYEHSPAEGQPIAMMMDYVVKKMEEDKEFGKSGSKYGDRGAEKIYMPEPNECIETWMQVAKRNVNKQVANLEFEVCKFPHFGKDFIKKKKLGPDSFVQMAIQLAYYKIHKKPGAQYESAHLRIFYGGRTETIRSCSTESRVFCEAMMNPKMNKSEKENTLRAAVNAHQEYTKLALQGKGVDRHLLGLKLMANENCKPVPELYKSSGFVKSSHFVLSTSQVATTYDAFMCYGPLTSDGYGCCYNPRQCDIIFAVSAWLSDPTTSAYNYCKELNWALLQMYDVLGGQPICKL